MAYDEAKYRMLIFGALPVGAIAGGLLGSAVGLRSALVISATPLMSPMLWMLFSPVFRLTEMPLGPVSDTSSGNVQGWKDR